MCTVEKCALHPFRFGKNPFRTKRTYTEEELEVMRERFKSAMKKHENLSEGQA